MQTTGDGVAATAELATGVQDGEDHLQGRDPFGRVDVDRDATAVVDDADATVFTDAHVDGVAVPGEGFVDGVVDDLLDQVVQTARAGRTDVHTGALADGLEPLEHLNLVCAVGRFALRGLRAERVLPVVFRFCCHVERAPACARNARALHLPVYRRAPSFEGLICPSDGLFWHSRMISSPQP